VRFLAQRLIRPAVWRQSQRRPCRRWKCRSCDLTRQRTEWTHSRIATRKRGKTLRLCRGGREGAPDDGVERGIAFVIRASLIRQFEFAQNVWINDRNFNEPGNERDPIIGTQDGTLEYKIPKRPIRKIIVGLLAFTTLKGGAYFFLPGLKALAYLASLNTQGQA
jgi:hypothetical protein